MSQVAQVDRLLRYIAVAIDKSQGARAVVTTRRGAVALEREGTHWRAAQPGVSWTLISG